MVFILTAGIFGFVLGLLLTFFPSLLEQLNLICDRVLLYLDEKLYAARIPAGIIIALLGLWILSSSKPNPLVAGELLAAGSIVVIVLGLLLLVSPKLVVKLSEWGNTMLVTSDALIIKARTTAGIVILLISIFLLFIASRI
jgi:hypothetical protein